MNTIPAPRALVVTGASRGIGAAVAEMAAARGWPVALLYRSGAGEAAAVVDRIHAGGGRAIAVQADVADEVQVEAAFTQVRERLGPIGGLVNSAGTTGGMCTVDAVEQAQLAALMATNISGTLLCIREAVKSMARDGGQGGGAVVNLSSRAACGGAPGVWVHYAATKGAVDTLTVGLARELAPRGIRVNAVRPGFIDTDIHAQRPTGALEALVRTVPMARMGRPAEVAAAVLWLLSEEASYVSGAIVDVAGAA